MYKEEEQQRRQQNPLESRLRGWLLLSIDGDQNAYRLFLEQTAALMRAYFLRALSSHTRSLQKAEDLVQEVLIAIHKKKHLYRKDMPVLPWIFAIARYRLIDSVRAESRRPFLVTWTGEETGEPREKEATWLAGVEDLDRLLEGLTQRQKEVLLLAKVEEIPLAEIASRLGMSLSAVKVTVHRAVKALRGKNKVST